MSTGVEHVNWGTGGEAMRRYALAMLMLCGGLALGAGCSSPDRTERTTAPEEDIAPLQQVSEDFFEDWNKKASLYDESESRYVRLTVLDKPEPFDVYLTWVAYDRQGSDGLGYSTAALFMWNGEEVARGERGFKEVLRRMAALPRGSRVLIYPYFLEPATGPGMSSPSDDLFGLPFDRQDMAPIVVERDLRVIWSPFDHQGRVHPQLADFWHFRWTDCKDCDAWITWKNYDGFGDPEEAIYVWNGREVGKGLEGFVEVLSRLDKIKPGSKVAIFPCYPGRVRGHLDEPARVIPFSEFWGLLREVVYRRNLIVLYSEDENPLAKKAPDAAADKKAAEAAKP